ncbi:MAG: hypothetical protein L3J10_06595 [Sulfurimonas sp.]|nr:hypothetical protein [Sulfurimonas sp.]
MKKIILSTVAALVVCTSSLSATQFYVDDKGQVFINPAEGRKALDMGNNEVSKTLSKQDKEDIKKEVLAEVKKSTSVFAKSSKLKFSGKHYLGFTQKHTNGSADNKGSFEMRRNYVQVKAYLFENPKDYVRVTLDSTYIDGSGKADIFVKYAYLYLNDILPSTGVEIGMVHKPWIDYESNNAWRMRSISKVFAEASEASKLTASADLGFNFRTNTPYFTSEIGLFNGEGYKASGTVGAGISAEWRTTLAFLGNGDKKRKATKDEYLDTSFFGQYNMKNSGNLDANSNERDFTFYGFHAVYNTPSFLIAGQYITADNDYEGTSKYNGDGYSINSVYRFGEKKQFSVLARYDKWTSEKESTGVEQTTNNTIYGVAWQQNKSIKWLLSGQAYEAEDGRKYDGSSAENWTSGMLTAEVKW